MAIQNNFQRKQSGVDKGKGHITHYSGCQVGSPGLSAWLIWLIVHRRHGISPRCTEYRAYFVFCTPYLFSKLQYRHLLGVPHVLAVSDATQIDARVIGGRTNPGKSPPTSAISAVILGSPRYIHQRFVYW